MGKIPILNAKTFRVTLKNIHKNKISTFFRRKTVQCPRNCWHLVVDKRCPHIPTYSEFLAIRRRKMAVYGVKAIGFGQSEHFRY